MSNGRPWPPDEISRLRRLVASGMTDIQIGEELTRHPQCVGDKRRRLNIAPGISAKLNAMMARVKQRRRAHASPR